MVMTSKKRAQQRHARQRFRERFGIELKPHVAQAIIRGIRDGKAKLVERQSLRVVVYRVSIEGKEMDIVYDRTRKTVVTALYPEAKV